METAEFKVPISVFLQPPTFLYFLLFLWDLITQWNTPYVELELFSLTISHSPQALSDAGMSLSLDLGRMHSYDIAGLKLYVFGKGNVTTSYDTIATQPPFLICRMVWKLFPVWAPDVPLVVCLYLFEVISDLQLVNQVISI